MVYRLENEKVTIEICERYISEEIFSHGPPDYEKQHPNWPGAVGLELEMLPVNLSTGSPQPLALFGNSPNVVDSVLNQEERKHWKWIGETGEGNEKIITRIQLEKGDNLSFEPGGQLEISTLPYPCLSDAVRRLKEVQDIIETSLVQHPEIGVTQIGMNPWHTTSEIGLQLPKKRYQSMNEYFTSIGPYGQKMMRQTCTIQVCLDFGRTDELLAKRYIASQLLSPYAAAIFAFSCISENGPTALGLRRKIWAETDPSRTGITLTQELLNEKSKAACAKNYFDFAMNARVIFIPELDFLVPKQPLSFREWIEKGYEGTFPTYADFKTHLSLLFPEVRPRGFLEIRSVDCQSKPWQFVPAAFYSSLLYDEDNLNYILEVLGKDLSAIHAAMRWAESGLEETQIQSQAKKLMQLAIEGFERLPPCFRGEGTEKSLLRFKEHFTDRNRCPSNDLKDVFDKQLQWSALKNLEDHWSKIANG